MKKNIFIYLMIFLLTFKFCYGDTNKKEIEILKNLRCLVCQGQSIADSNSDFAQTIKLVVRDQLIKGKSDDQIYTFLKSKYGEWIVYKPSFTKKNSVLWLIPYAVFIFGGIIIFVFTRKYKNN